SDREVAVPVSGFTILRLHRAWAEGPEAARHRSVPDGIPVVTEVAGPRRRRLSGASAVAVGGIDEDGGTGARDLLELLQRLPGSRAERDRAHPLLGSTGEMHRRNRYQQSDRHLTTPACREREGTVRPASRAATRSPVAAAPAAARFGQRRDAMS